MAGMAKINAPNSRVATPTAVRAVLRGMGRARGRIQLFWAAAKAAIWKHPAVGNGRLPGRPHRNYAQMCVRVCRVVPEPFERATVVRGRRRRRFLCEGPRRLRWG